MLLYKKKLYIYLLVKVINNVLCAILMDLIFFVVVVALRNQMVKFCHAFNKTIPPEKKTITILNNGNVAVSIRRRQIENHFKLTHNAIV